MSGEGLQTGDSSRLNAGSMQEQRLPVRDFGESEQNIFGNPRLRLFADFGSDEIKNNTGKRIAEYLKKLSEVNATKRDVQSSIDAITQELLIATFEQNLREDILLIPVLRSGLAMWDAANKFFGFPETSFVWGKRRKALTALRYYGQSEIKSKTDK